MKLRWGLALFAIFAVAPAFAQDVPLPDPLPAFHTPVIGGDSQTPDASAADPASVQQSDPAPAPAVQAPQPAPKALSVPAVPQPVVLTALLTDKGPAVQQGVVWRVYSTKPDAGGQLVLAAQSADPVAKIQLVPGDYVVDAAFGHAQVSDELTVNPGSNKKSLVLDVGGLRLNAAILGDVPIPINLLHFDIFTPGQSDADRAVVVQDLAANDIVMLGAGTYHVVSYFGDVNAEVRADLKVESGQLTDVTLYQRAAQISFKLVSETGGEAIADIDWTVKAQDGTTLFTNTGAFPATVLEEGDYTVFAKRGEQVYNREFQVQAGQPKEIEVLTTVY